MVLLPLATGVAGGLGLGYLLYHTPAGSGRLEVTINGSSYLVENLSWSQPQERAVCPGGGTPTQLYLGGFGGVTFNLTQLGTACDVIANGSFVFTAQANQPKPSPVAGYTEVVWTGNLGFNDRGLNWSHLVWISSNNLFGVRFFPDASQQTPWGLAGVGMYSYDFWLLVSTDYSGPV